MRILAVFHQGFVSLIKGEKASGGTLSNFRLLDFIKNEHDIFVTIQTRDIDKKAKKALKRLEKYTFLPIDIKFRGRGLIRDFIYKKNYYFQTEELLSKYDFDILICTTNLIYPMVKLAKKYNVSSISIIRAYENFYLYNNRKGLKKIDRFIRNRLFKKRDGVSLQKSDAVVTNSEYMSAQVKKEFNVQSKIIYPPIKIDDYGENSFYPKNNKIGVVKPSYKKGLNIIKKISKKFSEKDFIFFGSKPDNHKKIERTFSNIKFAGWTKKNEIYTNVDLMLVPSIWEEPFGRVPVESIASNTWVIVSNKGGLPETINSDESMMVNDVHDISAWEEKIEYFYNNLDKCREIFRNKKEFIRKFSLREQGQKFLDLIESI